MINPKQLHLQCSCRCGSNVFTLGPVSNAPLTMVKCHCRNCRLHSSSAFACYLTQSGLPFRKSSDIVFSKSNLRAVPFRCSSLGAFRDFIKDMGTKQDKLVSNNPSATMAKKKKKKAGKNKCGNSDTDVAAEEKNSARSDTEGGGDDSGTKEISKKEISAEASLSDSDTEEKLTRTKGALGSKENPRPAAKMGNKLDLTSPNAGTKVICDSCYSILYLDFQRPGCPDDDADQVVLAAGCIDDGDYRNMNKGRRGDQKLWPDEKFPKILAERPIWREMCKDQRAPWYIKQAGLSTKGSRLLEKVFTQREKTCRQKNISLPTEVRGTCLCGAVRFKCVRFPEEMQHCYCTLCRKSSGSAFQTWAPVCDEHLEWLGPEGKEKNLSHMQITKTSGFGKRRQCKTCGSTMTIEYNDEEGEYTWLSAGSFIDASLSELAVEGKFEDFERDFSLQKSYQYVEQKVSRVAHICCASVQPWYEVPRDVGTERLKGAG